MSRKSLPLLLAACVLVQGCAAVVVGGVLAGATALHDRRPIGTQIDDQQVENGINKALEKEPRIGRPYRARVTSYNGIVLLTGEMPDEASREQAAATAATVEGVRTVVNEMAVDEPRSVAGQAKDNLLGTKVKGNLFKVKGFPDFSPDRVKVIANDHTVYLLGLLTPEEIEAVVDVVRRVGGVHKVVKVFETIAPEQA